MKNRMKCVTCREELARCRCAFGEGPIVPCLTCYGEGKVYIDTDPTNPYGRRGTVPCPTCSRRK